MCSEGVTQQLYNALHMTKLLAIPPSTLVVQVLLEKLKQVKDAVLSMICAIEFG